MGSREACQKTTWKQRVAVCNIIDRKEELDSLVIYERGVRPASLVLADNSNVGGEWENGGGAIWCISEQ